MEPRMPSRREERLKMEQNQKKAHHTHSNKTTQRRTQKKKTKAPMDPKRKWISIALLGLGACACLVGAWMLLGDYFKHKAQDSLTAEMLAAMEQGQDTIEVDPNANAVEGEEMEGWGSATPAPTGKVTIEMIGRISIPVIDLDMPVAKGATTVNLRYAIGWMEGTAGIGEQGRCVLFGHRMYTYGRHFNRLDEVVVGSQIVLKDKAGTSYTYEVYDVKTVLPEEVPSMMYQSTEDKELMLVTCTPVRVATHRLLVYARMV